MDEKDVSQIPRTQLTGFVVIASAGYWQWSLNQYEIAYLIIFGNPMVRRSSVSLHEKL